MYGMVTNPGRSKSWLSARQSSCCIMAGDGAMTGVTVTQSFGPEISVTNWHSMVKLRFNNSDAIFVSDQG